MIDEYKILTEIMKLCLSLDIIACTTYNNFAAKCKIPALAADWRLRANEEKDHILFWKQALALSKLKQLPLFFKSAVEVRDKLKKIKKSLTHLLVNFDSYGVPSEELSLAFILESYMLDPFFMIMFHDYRFINKNIEDEYEKHILEFKYMAERYLGQLSSLQIELFTETLHNLNIANKEILKQSMHDSLTGFHNRRGFFNNITPILSLAERKKLDIGIIMIDFDNFKETNDSRGHQAGDQALKDMASIIKSNLRRSCISARYGGDEFIILSDIENSESLEVICERIRKNIEESSKKISGMQFTVSLGGATGKVSKQYEKSLAMIINKADKNLFKAKKNGKNSWIV